MLNGLTTSPTGAVTMSWNIYERFEKHADKTFADAKERYLAEFQGRDKTRVEAAIASVMPYIGTMRLIDIDDEAMAPFKRDRLSGAGPFDRPAMCGTVNKELTQVITILYRACRIWRWLPSTARFVHVTGDTRAAHPLTFEEQDRLF